jgi:hypothetical protein
MIPATERPIGMTIAVQVAQTKTHDTLSEKIKQKRPGGMAYVVKYLHSKCENLSSNYNSAPKVNFYTIKIYIHPTPLKQQKRLAGVGSLFCLVRTQQKESCSISVP